MDGNQGFAREAGRLITGRDDAYEFHKNKEKKYFGLMVFFVGIMGCYVFFADCADLCRIFFNYFFVVVAQG